MERKKVEYIEWICRKCGIMRCNKETHRHNVPITMKREDSYDKKSGEKTKE